MKVRIKATGEIINVERYGDAYAEVLPSCSERSYPEVYEFNELEFITEPNLQHYRIQFVGQIASAIMSNYEFYVPAIAEECKKSGKSRPEMVAQMSVEIADALVAELKKGGQDG